MTRTYILLFICVVVWGSNFIFGAILVNTFHPVLLTTLRLLFINLFFLAYAIMCKKGLYIEKNEMKGVLLIGVIGVAINQWSFYEGLQTADPTTAALILALTPVMTSILAVFILNEPLTAKLVIGGELLLLECFCNWCWAEVCLFRRVNMDFYNDAIFFFIYRFNSEIGEQRRYVFDYILFFNFWFFNYATVSCFYLFSHNVEILYRELVASYCDSNTYAWNLYIGLE